MYSVLILRAAGREVSIRLGLSQPGLPVLRYPFSYPGEGEEGGRERGGWRWVGGERGRWTGREK